MSDSPLSGVIGSGKGGGKPAAKKAEKKAPAAKKAAAKPAKKTDGVVRSASTVSKDGTQKDAYTGEELPVTAFPTMKNSKGEIVRGPVARKNLEAYRAENKKNREAAAKAKETAKAAAKAEKAAKDKAAAKAAPAPEAPTE